MKLLMENWRKFIAESHSKEHEEELEEIAGELENASEMHAGQAKRVRAILDETDDEELEEGKKKNCGCGQDPCITYGIQEAHAGDKDPGEVPSRSKRSMKNDALVEDDEAGTNPLQKELMVAVDTIVNTYEGVELPPPVADLKAMIEAGNLLQAHHDLKDMWNELLVYYRDAGRAGQKQKLPRVPSTAFNAIFRLLKKVPDSIGGQVGQRTPQRPIDRDKDGNRIPVYEDETLTEEEGCWDDYSPGAQSGVKTKIGKGGKRVNNCEEITEETDKDRMKCNSPRYIRKGEPGYGKKQKVVKACKDGKEKIIRFGDANMENKSDSKDNKSNFRSRHNCADKKDKFTAGYWACKDW